MRQCCQALYIFGAARKFAFSFSFPPMLQSLGLSVRAGEGGGGGGGAAAGQMQLWLTRAAELSSWRSSETCFCFFAGVSVIRASCLRACPLLNIFASRLSRVHCVGMRLTGHAPLTAHRTFPLPSGLHPVAPYANRHIVHLNGALARLVQRRLHPPHRARKFEPTADHGHVEE